jgi:integrase
MSLERLVREGGVVWRVRWREGGRNRSRVLGRKRDAEAFQAEIRRRKRTGDLAILDSGRQTLAEFAQDWWRLYARPNLARSTLLQYARLWDAYVLPSIGSCRLRELSPQVLEGFRADLAAAGVGPASQRKTLVILQGVLQRAVEWGHIPSNPARLVRKPSQRRTRAVRPMPPGRVEQIRQQLLSEGDLAGATLVSVLAYAGLRPGEALALTWDHIRERTILVERAVSLGEVKEPKTGRLRSVRLLAPLSADLSEWRLASGRPPSRVLVFPAHDGGPWDRDDWRNWTKRCFRRAAALAGAEGARPYDLRHSFCSLLLYEGRTIVEVARQAGHAPSMSLDTYQHVIDELEGSRSVPAEDQIRRARLAIGRPDVPVLYPPGSEALTIWDEMSRKSREPTRGLEPRTPSLRVKCSTS